MDAFGHCNNAMYARYAELARWHLTGANRLLHKYVREGIVFLVVEQTITYKRPILPFQRFVVRTTAHTTEGKWLHFEHSFESEAGDRVFAHASVRGVNKRADGRTVPPADVAAGTPWLGAQLAKGGRAP